MCQQYNQFLEQDTGASLAVSEPLVVTPQPVDGAARLTKVEVLADENAHQPLHIQSMVSTLKVKVAFSSSPTLQPPSVAIVITDGSGRNITSCSTHYDNLTLERDVNGAGQVTVRFPEMHLLRGQYVVNVFLMCERAIHIYDSARCAEFTVQQPGLEIGIVALRRDWSQR